MTHSIHPTAIIHPKAKIGAHVFVGPYCIVDEHVILDDHVRLISHVCVSGHTHIGEGTEIYPFASIGHAPQDLKYAGEPSKLIIGKRNKIREHVTMNPGTSGGGMLTQVGDDCLFMMSSHIAHDCQVGNNVILANNATLAGHVTVGDYAIIGGLSAVHQFVRVGAHAMIGGMSGVEHDVIPYGLVMGERARLTGLNIVGLNRRGYSKEQVHTLKQAYQDIFESHGTLIDRVEKVAQTYEEDELISQLVNFIKNKASRALCQPKSNAAA